MNFNTFFEKATGKSPYDYQCRLAGGELGDRFKVEWLSGGVGANSQLISIPTGLGKTAAVVLAWLWNRGRLRKTDWPRRLVYKGLPRGGHPGLATCKDPERRRSL